MFLPKWYFQFRPPYKYDEQYCRVTRTSYGFNLMNAVIFVKPEMYGIGKRNNRPHQLAPRILLKTN